MDRISCCSDVNGTVIMLLCASVSSRKMLSFCHMITSGEGELGIRNGWCFDS